MLEMIISQRVIKPSNNSKKKHRRISEVAGGVADPGPLHSLPEVKLENVDQHGRLEPLAAISGVGAFTGNIPEGLLLLWGELGPQLRIELFKR
jgi:hypothetical protein